MIITETQLRTIIRKALIHERRTIATVSDITRFMPQIEEWAEILIDELAEVAPRMKEMDEKRRKTTVKQFARGAKSALIDATSGMNVWDKERIDKEEQEKAHREWDKKRSQRVSGVQYYGDWGVTG